MAFTIPEVEPTRIYAGDRLQWKRTDLDDFPATAWTLTYYLKSNVAGGEIEISATADSSDFSIDVATTTTEGYTPATYYWSAFVSAIAGGDRKLVGQGRLEVLPDPTAVSGPTDGRSHARRVLDLIQAVIEGRATTDQQRYVFQAVGRSVDRMPIGDLLKFRNQYLAEVRAEEMKERIARGEASGKNVLVRFNL